MLTWVDKNTKAYLTCEYTVVRHCAPLWRSGGNSGDGNYGNNGDVGDIELAGCDRPLKVVGEVSGLGEAIGIDVDREHGGALGGETNGCRSTHAAGGAGQKCDAVGEAAHRG